jgi:hypothetical protein
VDDWRTAFAAKPSFRYVTLQRQQADVVGDMTKQRAFALLGPMLMLWGCVLTVGVAVYGFGDRLNDEDVPVRTTMAEIALSPTP